MTNKTRTSICTALADERYTASMYLRARNLQILYYLQATSAPLATDYKSFWEKR